MQCTSVCSCIDYNCRGREAVLEFEPNQLGFYRKAFSNLGDPHQLSPKCVLWAKETGAGREDGQGSEPEVAKCPTHWILHALVFSHSDN